MKFTHEITAEWHKQFENLKEFKQKHQHCNVPPDHTNKKLTNWVRVQRKIKDELPAALKEKLVLLEFDFSDDHYPWEDKFMELQQFAKKYGHAHVPATDPAYEELHSWLMQQLKNKEFLSSERKNRLDYLGVYWECKDLREWKWQEMYQQLEEYHRKYGNAKVPQKWPENRRLSNWVLVQRRRYAEGNMPKNRVEKLEKLDFVWDCRELFEDQWDEKFDLLCSFKKENGHTKVPLAYHDQRLAGWVDRQRTLKSKDRLLPEREERLNEIGFIWDCTVLQEQQWEERFQQLCDYRQRFGDCVVPVNWKENRHLGIWVSTQRTIDKHGNMDPEKKKRLDKIGFAWKNEAWKYVDKKYDDIWETNYQKLVDYKNKYGKLQVSLKIDRPLQRWTCAQRKFYHTGNLSLDRIEKLDEIGFAWDLHQAYWMKRYNQLVEFKKRFGHARVPWGWEENHKLGQWVSRTRLAGRKAHNKKQVALLDKLDFDWTVMKKTIIPWKDMYEQLVDFKKAFGHTRVPVNWPRNKKLGKWISRIRSEQHKLNPDRKQMLNKLDFDWKKRRGRLNRKIYRVENY